MSSNLNCLSCFRFPFFAADVLASNVTILQALTEGGWSNKKDEESDNDDKKSDKSGDFDQFGGSAENKLVQSILNKQTENVSGDSLIFSFYKLRTRSDMTF